MCCWWWYLPFRFASVFTRVRSAGRKGKRLDKNAYVVARGSRGAHKKKRVARARAEAPQQHEEQPPPEDALQPAAEDVQPQPAARIVPVHQLGMWGKRVERGVPPQTLAKVSRFTPKAVLEAKDWFIKAAALRGQRSPFLTRSCSQKGAVEMRTRLEKYFSVLHSDPYVVQTFCRRQEVQGTGSLQCRGDPQDAAPLRPGQTPTHTIDSLSLTWTHTGTHAPAPRRTRTPRLAGFTAP